MSRAAASAQVWAREEEEEPAAEPAADPGTEPEGADAAGRGGGSTGRAGEEEEAASAR